jgi:hypothetical protein
VSHRLALVALLIIVLAAGLAVPVLAQAPATIQVGLVIAFPDGSTHLEIVTIPNDATTFDVLKAANVTVISQSSQYGQALCKINTTGCPIEDCFCDAQHFWAYYHLTNGAREQAAGSVDAYKPADRAVEGLAWSGFDASYNPTDKPPVYTFDQIVAATQPTPTATATATATTAPATPTATPTLVPAAVPAPVQVPEPSTLLLLGGGLAGLAAWAANARRNRK